jgi:arylsulfatase
MLKNSRVQLIAMLAIGGLLGFAAASGKLDVFRKVSAEPPQPIVTDKESSSVEVADAPCCSEGLARGQLVALAAPKVRAAAAKIQANGKKPNIVFIMGDDVGWFNIGAYHQGIMSGKTPNLDKLASQGMRFTDYYGFASRS